MSISIESNSFSSGFGEMPKPHVDSYMDEKSPLVSEFEGPAVLNSARERDRSQMNSLASNVGRISLSSERPSDSNYGLL